MREDQQVLVVGAGPTGLVNALCLAQQQIAVTVLEKGRNAMSFKVIKTPANTGTGGGGDTGTTTGGGTTTTPITDTGSPFGR